MGWVWRMAVCSGVRSWALRMRSSIATLPMSWRQGRRDEVAVHSAQAVDVGLLAQTLQQDAGDALHPGDVVDALAVVDLRDLAEDADHDLVVLLPVIELLGHQRTETALTGVEPGDIGDAAVDDAGIEGAADVVRSTQLVGAADGLGGILAGDHHDGDVLEPALGGHPGEDVEAVHVGHHDVQQHDGNIRAPGVQKLEALRAVGGFPESRNRRRGSPRGCHGSWGSRPR